MDNFEEYADPELYDKENNPFKDDIELLLKWARDMEGPIIDIACGTGRATIPLAQKGYNVIGVDVHTRMLEEAEKKSEKLGLPIEWVAQDCCHFQLNVKSYFIYTVGNSFQHFLSNEEQDALLSSVNKHLVKGGIFIFGTRFPNKEELLQPNTEEYWRTYQDNHQTVDVYTISTYDSLNQIQHYTTIRRFKDEAGRTVHEKRTNIRLRYVYPKEMERILSANGFEILHLYGDWNESPITNDSHQMIYVCRKV
jgi:2-polyprenyl-3-methyl-5-hydroxy-6-metoxy-1,4-benzoquinol methylase